ncbi:toll/interleukin-1 receptor domain-containing protein [Citrobacter portucalensis]|uniref:toll/interleukin-1 receptor domain-containing protein n=1 Tax=Citrobacter portucalensis TaxID=1639133 RepID=UPI00244A5BD4|nr:toll/interleukin-1 receptor domain-containing protein [Citrobacter portucalensis]MDH1795234.1 toll/interleukin-1 receptor domain-containing protein [Citrobacter portucalensis]
MNGKGINTIALIMIIIGCMGVVITKFPYVLNSFNDETLVLFVSGAIAYVGMFLVLFKRMKDRRVKIINRGKKIFLIYSALDYDKAMVVTKKLADLGYEIWSSQENILPGQVIERQINDAIENSAVAIYLASNHNDSNYQSRELNEFINNSRVNRKDSFSVIPIVIDNAELPDPLKSVMYVNYEDDNLYDKLSRALSVMVKE